MFRNLRVNSWLGLTALIALPLFHIPSVSAGEADVLDVEAEQSADGTWRFSVTVQHEDAGWEHYADAWVVLGPDGKVLGERVLLHPHDVEQPFTRSLSGVVIPDGITSVTVRAKDLVHGFGGKEMVVQLTQ